MELEKLTMQLIMAINKEDLDKTKKLVEQINNLYETTSMGDLTNMLNFYPDGRNYSNYLDNKSLDYAINNLYSLNNIDEIILLRKKAILLRDNNLKNIEDFLDKQLATKEVKGCNKNLFIQVLIELTVLLRDPSKIEDYFLKINNLIKEEESKDAIM